MRTYANMLIHHYANIESLAMILKSEKVLFNCLDRMDDLEDSALAKTVQMGYGNIRPILYRCGL